MRIELPTDAQPTTSENQNAIMGGNRDLLINQKDKISMYENRLEKKIKKGWL